MSDLAIGPLERGLASLAASTSTTGETAIFYIASARLCLVQAREKLGQLERLVLAREEELLATTRATQLAFDAPKGGAK